MIGHVITFIGGALTMLVALRVRAAIQNALARRRYQRAVRDLEGNVAGLKLNIGRQLLPAFRDMGDALDDSARELARLDLKDRGPR